jgi:hypothetical protein
MRRHVDLARLGTPVLAFALGLGLTARAGGVEVRNPIPYASQAEVRQAVRTECRVGEKLAGYLEHYAEDVELVTGEPGGGGR